MRRGFPGAPIARRPLSVRRRRLPARPDILSSESTSQVTYPATAVPATALHIGFGASAQNQHEERTSPIERAQTRLGVGRRYETAAGRFARSATPMLRRSLTFSRKLRHVPTGRSDSNGRLAVNLGLQPGSEATMHELNPSEDFEPSRDTKSLWRYTRKAPARYSGLTLPVSSTPATLRLIPPPS